MIYDNLNNIELYKGLSNNIYEGLVFLKQAKPDLAKGVYQINPRVKTIVSEYETKLVNEYSYEAHKKFIDIQYVLRGEERVCCLPVGRLKETKPYDAEVEAAFYKAEEKPQEMIIGNGYFAIFFPQDGHMPQLCVDYPQFVIKAVIKVEVYK